MVLKVVLRERATSDVRARANWERQHGVRMMDDVPVTEGNKDVIYGDGEQAAIALDIRAPTDADNDALTVTIDTVPDASIGTILLDGQAIAGGTTLSVSQL